MVFVSLIGLAFKVLIVQGGCLVISECTAVHCANVLQRTVQMYCAVCETVLWKANFIRF